MASSVSRPLLLGMAMVALRARGAVASVYAGKKAGTATIEGRVVKTRDTWILSFTSGKPQSAFILDDGAWKKVRKIDPKGEAEVWDLRVAGDESFTAEGCIVHNCPLALPIIRRAVTMYSNPGEVVCSPFGGVGSEGVGALRLGRKAVLIELKESYFKRAAINLRDEENAHQMGLFAPAGS